LFGKVNYDFKDKYLASVTLRNDESSKLAPGYNAQTFPAFSLGWRVSDENFFNGLKNIINEMKVRAGWGQTGNQQITDYSFYSTYAPNYTVDNTYYDIHGSNNTAVTGYSQNRIGNNSLRWETSTQINIGFDVSAFNNKVSITADLFDKKTKNLLVQPQLPSTFGAATPSFINGGSMDNKGIELEAGYDSRTGSDFNYSLSGNISFTKNELTSLTPDLSYIPSPVSNTLTRNFELQRSVVGYPIASFYGYKVLGIFQNQNQVDKYVDQPGKAVGHFIYADENKDGVVNDDDRIFLGSPEPSFNYGFNVKVSYKNFNLWAFVQGVGGNSIFNFTKEYTDFFSSPSAANKSTRLLNAWSSTNMINNGPPILTVSNTSNDTRPSSYFVESGAYARLKTIQIGYTFLNPFKKSSSIRVYLQAQNLFTITKYSGMDPEVGLQNYNDTNSNLDIGVDRGIYPASRIFLIGVNAKF
jgi:TonB-linked SusC/RagA family outer membrane protein